MGQYQFDRPDKRMGISSLTWLLAGVLALALMGGLAVSRPSGALADGNTACDQYDLQRALNSQSTISFAPGCTINLTSSLVVQAGADITIDGNGLVLNGEGSDVIDIYDDEAASTLSLNRVTVEHGLEGIKDKYVVSTVNLYDSTIGGNNSASVIAKTVNVTQSTILGNDNSAIFLGPSTYTFTGSLLASNGGANCFGASKVIDDGYNLSSDDSCGFSGTSKNSVPLTSATPGVGLNLVNGGDLGNFGGATQTIALGAGSIAIEYIPSADCPTTVDQRGVTRPQGAGCDVGAYEAISGPYTVTHSTCPTQQELQGDFDLTGTMQGKLLTIDVTKANCIIDLSSSLQVGAGADITLNGDGLKLSGATATDPTTAGDFDLIAINDTGGSPSTLTLDGVTLEEGENGIHDANTAAIVTLSNSTVSGNGRYGVYAGSATVTNSTISGNANGIDAGGATITDSTISDNGVGINVRGSATVTSSTISGNDEIGIFTNGSATVTATILSGSAANCGGSITDGGYNRSTDSTCNFSGTSKNGVTDLNLLGLGDYGGPTPTIALGPGSSAIDAIPPADCATIIDPTTSQAIATDQRGVARPQGTACDIGAYEAPAVKITPTTSPASTGWYNATTLGGTGKTLRVAASFSGLAGGNLPACSGATFTGLPPTAVSGLNQKATGTGSLGDGTYSLSCGVSQGTTALGISYSGPTQPLDLKIDTTDPKVAITSPIDKAVILVGSSGSKVAFSCSDTKASDGATGSGIGSTDGCAGSLDGTTITSGTALDTGSGAVGNHTLKVTAADQAGNSSSQTVTYQVEELTVPTITVNDGTSYTNAGYWYNLSNSGSGVTVTVSDSNSLVTSYTCTDNGSTLSLTLSNDTPPSGTADLGDGIHHLSCAASASGVASAATTTTVQVDLTRPTITSPVANHQYILNAPVSLNCTDPNGADNATGSGIASCQVTVTLPGGATQTVTKPDDLPTSQLGSYTVKAKHVTDVAGNDDTTSFSYTVGYQLVAQPGNTTTVTHGYFAMIRFAAEDANGHDYASWKLTATSVELDGPNGQVVPFVHQFQFTMAHNTPQYQLELNTRNLEPGEWTLKLTLGNDTAIVYSVNFTIE